MLLSKCALYNSEKPRFIKEQEASGSLSSIGTKASLSQIFLAGPLLFWSY